MFRWSCGSVLAAAVLTALAGGGAASAASAALPDGRAYELVSPPDKNGSDISQGPGSIRAADVGDAVSYNATGGFNTQGTGANGEVTYIARRGSSAWSEKSISVPQVPNAGATIIGSSYPFLSDDLSRGVLYAFDPVLTPDAQPGIKHLYARDASGAYTWLDVNQSGSPINPATVSFATYPQFADVTPDFGHVIFEYSVRLTPDASPGNKLYEWDHGTVRVAGILPDGTVAPSSQAGAGANSGNNTDHTISDDGSKIFFSNGSSLYMRQDATSTVMLSESENTTTLGTGGGGFFLGATPNGDKVLFRSTDQLVDADVNAGTDLYMYDTTRPSTDPHNLTLLSADNEPADGGNPDVQGVLGMSDDGRYVYFAATGMLVSGQPVIGAGNVGLYLWHDGIVRYIANLGSTASNDANWGVRAVPPKQREARVTPDGKHLLFSTTAPQPEGYDNAGKRMFYLYDADSDEARCVTCNPEGRPATADAAILPPKPFAAPTQYAHLSRALSADGHRVFFHTRDALVPDDVNQRVDVYEYDALTSKLALISTGRDGDDSFFGDASADGNDVYFLTRSRLVGWDEDHNLDLYDAKVGGGLPEPPASPRQCLGDDCQGAPSSIPGLAALGSTTFSGVGDTPARVLGPTGGASKVKVLRRTIKGSTIVLTVKAPAKGRLSARGSALRGVTRSVARAGTYTLKVRLTATAGAALARKHELKVRVRVGYAPVKGKSSSTTVVLTVKA